MKLLIAGDLFIADDRRGREFFAPSIVDLFRDGDYRLVNLEAPLCGNRRRDRILKTGPHLRSSLETTLPALKRLGIDAVTLANNHIMDYGGPGLRETITGLRAAGISTVGAGAELSEASVALVLEKRGVRVRILNFAENEWANAGRAEPGANPLDIVENTRAIRHAKAAGDFVVVVIHGGHELFGYPDPAMRRQFRFYAENGASAIVGHHTHAVGAWEIHQGVPIFYGLGNFLFTLPSKFDGWYTGLVLSLDLRHDRGLAWDLHPVRQSKEDDTVTLLEGSECDAVMGAVAASSRVVSDDDELERQWEGYLTVRRRQYLNIFSPVNGIPVDFVRLAFLKLGLDTLFIRRSHYARVLNHLRCEANAEAAKGVLERFLRPRRGARSSGKTGVEDR